MTWLEFRTKSERKSVGSPDEGWRQEIDLEKSEDTYRFKTVERKYCEVLAARCSVRLVSTSYLTFQFALPPDGMHNKDPASARACSSSSFFNTHIRIFCFWLSFKNESAGERVKLNRFL